MNNISDQEWELISESNDEYFHGLEVCPDCDKFYHPEYGDCQCGGNINQQEKTIERQSVEHTDKKTAFTGFFGRNNQPIMVGDVLKPVNVEEKLKNFNGKGRKWKTN